MEFELPEVIHHGAVSGVTGSCHQLRINPSHSFLVDCGLFQGNDGPADEGAVDSIERQGIDFDVSNVRALVVTHVHIDHIGRLPYLEAAGFQGPIVCSIPSARLLPLVIEDALKVGFTRDRTLIQRFLNRVRSRIVALDYGVWHVLLDEPTVKVRVRLQRAGHILGSAYVEFDVQQARSSGSSRVVFSGDLGAPHAPLLPAPRPPSRADMLVLESTYGDRNHEDRRTRQRRLASAIEHAIENGGTVIVPAFSIGRTQELLYELESIIHNAWKGAWRSLPIIVDSPLAAQFTEAYGELKTWWDAEAKRRVRSGRHPLDFSGLHTVDGHAQHLRTVSSLAKSEQPAVVLAASGMAAGGRVVNYLKAMIENSRHDVLFVGYQARRTPGRAIQEYGPKGGWVELDGRRYAIRARVTTIGGYSAHAGRRDLLRFVAGIRNGPRLVRLVHGDDEAKRSLAGAIRKQAADAGRELVVEIGHSTS